MRITTLQWAVGMFCAVVGAMMLIVPHRFEAPFYAALVGHLTWWGIAFLAAGGCTLAAAVFAPPRALAFAAHLLAGLVLLSLAHGFASSGNWVRALAYGILGVGTALAPLLPGARDDRARMYGRDLLALLLGMSMLVTGLAIFVTPAQFNGRLYDAIRIQLPWYGVAFTAVGLLLVYLQVRPQFPRTLGWIVYLAAGGTLLVFLSGTAAWQRGWTGITYYGGFGILLALLPWLDPILQRLKPTSLRVRLALVLIVAVAAPLIVAVSVVTDRAERSATAQALALQEEVAQTLADDISRFVAAHRSAAAALARTITLSRMAPSQQASLLNGVAAEYPDVFSYATYDAWGHLVARGDAYAPEFIAGEQVFEESLHANAAVIGIKLVPFSNTLLFEFGAPLRGPGNAWAGLVVLSTESTRVILALNQGAGESGLAYLVDGQGRVLVHRDSTITGSFRDVSGLPPVAALLSSTEAHGAIRYKSAGGSDVAGYGRVQGTTWGVVVERPLAVALAGAHAGREIAFVILLLMMVAAATAGTFVASALARPLEALARETKRLGEGDAPLALPDSGIAEVRDLSVTFGEMRDRLAARTWERAAAEEELRRQNAYLAALHDTALGLIKRLDLTDLLEAIVTRAGELVGTPDGHLYLVSPDRDELESKVAIGAAASLKRTRLGRGQGVGGRVWATGEPLVIDDYDTWPGRLPGSPLGLHHGVVGIPLKSDDRVLGVMILRYREPGRTFRPDAVELLGRFAELAALALNNARLHGALQEREARIRSIMDSTSDGFILVGRDGAIKSMSQRVREMLPLGEAGQEGGDLAAALARTDVRPAHREAVVAAVHAFLEGTQTSAGGDLELAGGNRVLEWDAQPVRDASGGTVGLIFTLRDVTQDRQVSRMKSDFVSFVTHQLRTPLAGIKWLLELAAGTQDAGEVQAYIQDARDANERLVNLVNDLLDISRLESGRLVITPRELHLGEMTRNVLEELTPLINEKGHRLSVSGEDRIPPVVADPQLLRQVVMNLLSNAIKYTPSPGEIALEMRQENGAVQWTIHDNGIGIPKDALPRLFEKFFRADNVHKIETEGTGLGLYLVRLIVERLGGRIWCESEEGRGSTFLFTVPLAGG